MKFKNRRVTVKVGKTINLGDFNSFRMDTELSVDICDKYDLAKVYSALFDEAESNLLRYEEEVLNEKD